MQSRILVAALLFAASVSCSSSSSKDAPPLEAVVAEAPALPSLGMNDVSVLIPLSVAKTFLEPASGGAKGVLLPKDVYDKVPKFGVEPAEGLVWERMRAVAIRFDGCFSVPSGCEAQIRIVMQPLLESGMTNDSALHLFYRLTEDELAAMVPRLRHLRELAPEATDGPLDVSPALVAQGAEGPYATALRELVLELAGEQSFSRMTFFLRAPPLQEEWFFGGFDRLNGTLRQLDIVGVGKSNQRVDRPDTAEGYEYAFTPAGKVPEDVSALLVSAKAKTAPVEDVKKAFAAFLRIENPTKYGPDALPCAGCHVSTVVTEHAKKAFGFDAAAEPDAFTSTRDLTMRGAAASSPPSLRGFGYLVKQPMIGRRVINETAAVVDDLEKRFPATPAK